MTRILFIVTTVLIFLILFQTSHVNGQEGQKSKQWTSKPPDGKILTIKELGRTLLNHKKWLQTEKKEGKQANLRRVDLSGVNLSGADLSGADLIEANLNEANLKNANLSGALLGLANLSKANLFETNLSKANLIKSNLEAAKLIKSNLSQAILIETDLNKANLIDVDLSQARMLHANLSKAKLTRVNLNKADMTETNLSNCRLYSLENYPLVYEPKGGSTPYIPILVSYSGIEFEKLTFEKTPHGLVDLREGFKKFGYRKQERQITYAIKSTQRRKLWNDEKGNLWNKIESLLYFLFFEITCKYGMKPGRPIVLIIPLIIIFAVPYTIVLKNPPGRDGIWKIWIPDRVRRDLGAKDPYRLNLKLYSALLFGLYFSLLSAFSIGWRDLNVGNWISRIQQREYTLRATGWVRTVSGVQSLISVYLLALWVLTYFGRPFETI